MRYRRVIVVLCAFYLLGSLSVASAAITDDLVRHYKLDESAGATEAVDATATKNLLVDAGGGGPIPTPGATGIIDGAWDFERDNSEFLDEGDAVWNGFFHVAASIWVKPESLDPNGSNEYTVFSEDAGTLASQSKDAVLSVTDQGAVRWRLELAEPNWTEIVTSDGVITNAAWNHVAVVKKGATASIYIDGALSTSATVPNITVDSVNDLMLGAFEDSDASDAWDGLIDDAGFWHRALDPFEVASIYQQGLLGNDLTNAIPEPATWLLVVFGLLAGSRRGRRGSGLS